MDFGLKFFPEDDMEVLPAFASDLTLTLNKRSVHQVADEHTTATDETEYYIQSCGKRLRLAVPRCSPTEPIDFPEKATVGGDLDESVTPHESSDWWIPPLDFFTAGSITVSPIIKSAYRLTAARPVTLPPEAARPVERPSRSTVVSAAQTRFHLTVPPTATCMRCKELGTPDRPLLVCSVCCRDEEFLRNAQAGQARYFHADCGNARTCPMHMCTNHPQIQICDDKANLRCSNFPNCSTSYCSACASGRIGFRTVNQERMTVHPMPIPGATKQGKWFCQICVDHGLTENP